MALIVTDSAAAQLGSIVEEHGIEESQGLRLFARSGGCACSGPAFGMTIDKPADEDQVIVVSGIRFIIDPLSASNLDGASIDYIDTVMQQGFTIEAPNAGAAAGAGCACGGHGEQDAHAHGAGGAACACGGH
jgi:iron-sulfur cluster assembly accessory protein